MAPDVLTEALARHLTQCSRELARARRGVPRGVHQARVASRRLREGLGALESALPPGTRRRALRVLRKLSRALGAVRECDVTLELITTEAERFAWSAPTVTHLRAVVTADRRRHHHQLLRTVAETEWRAVFSQVRKRMRRVSPAQVRSEAGASARGRRIQRARTLVHALSDVGAVYVPDQLHTLRIAAKKLRYALEWEQQIGGKAWVRERRLLEAAQEELGDWHDRLVLQERIHRLRRAGDHPRGMTTDFKHMAAELERECRARHAAILARVPALTRLGRTAAR
jgi:CHAD domain-containing protein